MSACRPGPITPIDNLFLAGDWIRTGLPATIESAVASGHKAAALAEQQTALRCRRLACSLLGRLASLGLGGASNHRSS